MFVVGTPFCCEKCYSHTQPSFISAPPQGTKNFCPPGNCVRNVSKQLAIQMTESRLCAQQIRLTDVQFPGVRPSPTLPSISFSLFSFCSLYRGGGHPHNHIPNPNNRRPTHHHPLPLFFFLDNPFRVFSSINTITGQRTSFQFSNTLRQSTAQPRFAIHSFLISLSFV